MLLIDIRDTHPKVMDQLLHPMGLLMAFRIGDQTRPVLTVDLKIVTVIPFLIDILIKEHIIVHR